MRKHPIRHSVQCYRKKNGTKVDSFMRGQGQRTPLKMANPTPRTTLTDSRLEYKIKELKEFKEMAKPEMKDFYETIINFLEHLKGKTRKQMQEAIWLKFDELSSARMSKEPYGNIYAHEQALTIASKLTGISPPKIKYNLATDKKQSANIIGYRPNSEKLVWMTPEQYLLLTPPTHYDDKSLKTLKNRMLNNQEIDALWLDVDVNTKRVTSHEGRHRAQMAENIGIQKVPVVLYARDGYDWANKRQLPSVENLRRQSY